MRVKELRVDINTLKNKIGEIKLWSWVSKLDVAPGNSSSSSSENNEGCFLVLTKDGQYLSSSLDKLAKHKKIDNSWYSKEFDSNVVESADPEYVDLLKNSLVSSVANFETELDAE